MSDKKIDLIAQMLAKAESTTPEEAEALTAAAEKLMVKYMIDQATIDSRRATSGKAEDKITKISIRFSGAYRLEFINLGAAVTKALGALRVLQTLEGNKAATLHIYGFKSDAEQAETLIKSLQIQSMVAVREWWKGEKPEYAFETSYNQEAARRAFVRGFGNGAGKRIADSKQHIVQEAGKGTELVLVNRDIAVQDYFDSIPQHASQNRRRKTSQEAQAHGYVAGKNANTGERAMTQGRGLTA